MIGSYRVLGERSLYVLRATALTGGAIDYWQLSHAVATKMHPVPARRFGRVLEWTDRFCMKEGLPHLTSLVVYKHTGEPSLDGMAAIGVTDWRAEQERCWAWGRAAERLYNLSGKPWHDQLPTDVS